MLLRANLDIGFVFCPAGLEISAVAETMTTLAQIITRHMTREEVHFTINRRLVSSESHRYALKFTLQFQIGVLLGLSGCGTTYA